MKVHPNNFVLEEFLLSQSESHLAVLEHLTVCSTCRRRVQGFRREYVRQAARRLAEVLPWPGTVTDYDGARRADHGRYARFFHGMLSRGHYLPPSG